MCLVFEELLETSETADSCRDLASPRLVCSAWNRIILSCPSLWRYIVVEELKSLSPAAVLSNLRLVLGRSGACLLFVHLAFTGLGASTSLCTDVCAAIAQHIDRLEMLNGVFDSAAQARALAQLDSAPRLQWLCVGFNDPSAWEEAWFEPLDPALFGRPMSLMLAGTGLAVLLRPDAVSLSRLRKLIIMGHEFVWTEMEEMLGLCPALEDLSIRGFNFAPRGDVIPRGQMTLPLRRLELDNARAEYPEAYMLFAALLRLPLCTTRVIEIGRGFAYENMDLLKSIMGLILLRLPVLATFSVSLDDDELCMAGTLASEGDDSPDPEPVLDDILARTLRLPETTSKQALRKIQCLMRAALANALLFERMPAFARLTRLCIPLSIMAWNSLNRTLLDGALPGVVQLHIIWDLRSFDERVPFLPRLPSLRFVRLLRPESRRRMVLTTDKVEKLLCQYRMASRPALILCGVQIIMLEHDLDRFVTSISEEEFE